MGNTCVRLKKRNKKVAPTPTYSAVQTSSTSTENAHHKTDHGSGMEAQTSTRLVELPPDETYYHIWYRHTGEPNLDKFPEYRLLRHTREAEILAEIGQNQITHAFTDGNLTRLEVIAPKVTHLIAKNLPDPQQLQRLSSLSNLKELTLDGNKFNAGLPAVVGRLTSLETLNISYCRLDDLPESLSSLSNLKELTLDGNNFNAGLPAVVGGLTSLEILNISYCGLDDLPESLSSLIHLRNLDLSSNDFSMGLPPVVNTLTSLETLNLYYCWSRVDLLSLAGVTMLRPPNPDDSDMSEPWRAMALRSRDSRLVDLSQSLSSLTNLRELDLSENERLEDLSIVLGKLTNLEILRLSDCELENLPQSLSSLTNLRELDLSGNKHLENLSNVIGKLSNLEKLNLRECELENLPERFSSEATLQILDLSYNNILHLPSVVYKMKNLRQLNLSSNVDLKQIDKEILQLQKLHILDCDDCYSLRSPPYEVCKQGFSAVCKFFSDLEMESGHALLEVPVAVVGLQRSGKSSLIRSLIAGERMLTVRNQKSLQDETTEVFQLQDLNLKKSRLKLIDYGGHEVYHMAYQLVIKERCIPVIVVNMEQFKSLSDSYGFEEGTRRVCFDWLSHLYLAGPRLESPILILTHTDRLTLSETSQYKGNLLSVSEVLRIRMLQEEQQLAKETSIQPSPIPYLENSQLPLFNPEDIFEFSNDPSEIANIKSLNDSLDHRCQKWKTPIPRLWEKVEEFVDEHESLPFINLNNITEKFDKDDPLIILRYMHNTGKVLWYEDLDELRGYVFHQIPAITKMISLLFHHSVEEKWHERLTRFTAFTYNGRTVGIKEYETLVDDFNATGLMDGALLFHIIKSNSAFPLDVATILLKNLHILHGPIEESYILPYFSKSYMDNSWKLDDRIPLRLDIVFGGLTPPQYVYQLTTVVVLNCTKSQLTDVTVKKNGAVICHGDSATYLIHDYNNRKLTLQISTTVCQLDLSWKRLIGTGKSILNQITQVWKASYSEVLIYCAQCLIADNSNPSYHTNPRWFYQIDADSSTLNIRYVPSISRLEKVRCRRCGDSNKNKLAVPKPLRFPCEELSSDEIEFLESHIRRVRGDHPSLPEVLEDTPTKLEANEQLEESDISDVEEKGYCDAGRDKRLSLKLRLVKKNRIKQLYRNTDEVYPMSDQIRGRVLIINISEFSGAPARTGSDLDCEHLRKLFTDLKFVVSMATQKGFYTAEEVRMAVREETKQDEHHRYKMFVLVLMSHGTEGNILLDSHCKPFSLVSIQDLLSPRNFAAMKGKPKLVIVQACSGGRPDAGEAFNVAPAATVPTNQFSAPAAAPSEQPGCSSASQASTRLLHESEDDGPCYVTERTCLNADDFLYLKASSESYSATRSLTHGSWFIRVLVATFYRHANHRDVESLFKIIQKRVREVSLKDRSASTSDLSGNVPTSICTFTNYRKLYLFPGYPSRRSEF